ncbi:DUF3541 domain-containing protein [Billgrantia pellis]|uniref:DUF3541 domain-containing protein n=1 Tax=Billgrantia pellis TaxID=2606936 RepID=A0A7V7G0P5_9GAMM|nr:DUF3541 domain-containing protein [Halomonas pellis]KAA0013050.1 DUF3541 domain-containing protein [Halomonas pellis]
MQCRPAIRVYAMLWLLAGCVALAPTPTPGEAGRTIQAIYDAALPELSHDKQRHYAQRLYRISGDPAYLSPLEAHAQRLLRQLQDAIAGLAKPGYAAARSRELVAEHAQRTAKQRARRAMLAEWGEIAFGRKLLFRLVQSDYYGLLAEVPGHERALDYLAGLEWQSFLTDPEVIRIYAAQVANQAEFLHQLGVVDLRHETRRAFLEVYPPDATATLDEASYHNRLYGMTHMIIADSRYYQRWADPERHAWVLDAFAREIDRIVTDATADIQAEVALSFLLAGQPHHPAVARIRQALVAAIDPSLGIIPSPSGNADLIHGEHRNVLAIMVLTWPGQLHPGPDLSRQLPEPELLPVDNGEWQL